MKSVEDVTAVFKRSAKLWANVGSPGEGPLRLAVLQEARTIRCPLKLGGGVQQRLHFVDEDGKSAFLRAGDIAMLTIPLWVLDPDERFYDDEPDENNDLPPSPLKGEAQQSSAPPQASAR
jgi:hypothetical protein